MQKNIPICMCNLFLYVILYPKCIYVFVYNTNSPKITLLEPVFIDKDFIVIRKNDNACWFMVRKKIKFKFVLKILS